MTPPKRYSAREFLVVLVLTFLLSPFADRTGDPRLAFAVLMTAVLLSAGFAVGDKRNTRVWALLATVPAITFLWLHHLVPKTIPLWYGHALIWLYATWVSFRLFLHVLRAKRVDGEVLSAAAATYLLAALAWGVAYIVVGDADPQAFVFAAGTPSGHSMKGFTALYFSLATITTVGYGDIMPVSPLARLLAMVEAVGGMFYMTMLIARLVSVYSAGKPGGDTGE